MVQGLTSTRLGAEGVSRRFDRVTALDAVTLSVQPATVHALLGENGAGKTTLIRCLSGLDTPDSGTVIVNDQQIRFRGPRHALAQGVAVVQQELALAPNLTLLENLALGQEPHRGPVINWATARARGIEIAADIGTEIDWDAPARSVPMGTLQQVEIIRSLYRGADTLILDEPTSVLAPSQIDQLLALLARMRDGGRTIVFITHKLDEVLAVADNVTVLRAGRVVAEQPASGMTRERLAELVVGGKVAPLAVPRRSDVGTVSLDVHEVVARDQRGRDRLGPVSLSVRRGEIVGVAGVAGNGQDELVAVVTGLHTPAEGRVMIDNRDATSDNIAHRRALGLGYIAADRKHEGLSLGCSLVENIVAGVHRGPRVARGFAFNPKRARILAIEVLERFGVRYGDHDDPASALSGGNQQRVVVGRELSRKPVIVVAVQPTRGVDIRGIREIHAELLAARDRGAGILLISEELDELLALSDHVLVLHRGRISDPVLPGEPNARARIGALMLGDHAQEKKLA
jgi:simple sugar transport system ATP-binding protein